MNPDQTSLLPTIARARRGDPETSHLAARSVKLLTETQTRVSACLSHGPGTDDDIIDRYRRYHPCDLTTNQSIRSRRAELVSAGFVRWTGEYGKSRHGGKSRVWGLV
jgi:hypothetical protein